MAVRAVETGCCELAARVVETGCWVLLAGCARGVDRVPGAGCQALGAGCRALGGRRVLGAVSCQLAMRVV